MIRYSKVGSKLSSPAQISLLSGILVLGWTLPSPNFSLIWVNPSSYWPHKGHHFLTLLSLLVHPFLCQSLLNRCCLIVSFHLWYAVMAFIGLEFLSLRLPGTLCFLALKVDLLLRALKQEDFFLILIHSYLILSANKALQGWFFASRNFLRSLIWINSLSKTSEIFQIRAPASYLRFLDLSFLTLQIFGYLCYVIVILFTEWFTIHWYVSSLWIGGS